MKLTIPDDAPDYPTILHALESVARRVPERLALVCEDRTMTFAEYEKAVAGLARQLQEVIEKGDRVAVLMTNCLETPICILGAMASHAYVAPMNPGYSDRELEPLLRDADPKLIVTLPEFEPRACRFARAMGISHVWVVGQECRTVAAWIEAGQTGLPRPLPRSAELAMMFFTGGTTGLPKAAEHRHRNIMAFCRMEAAISSILQYDQEVSLSVAPMFHIFGHHHGIVYPIYVGSTHVIVRQYKPVIVIEQLTKYRVTVFAGGPATVYVGLLANEAMKTADLSYLKICNAGGAPCSEDLLRNWEATTGCPMLEGIGMSEGAPIANNPAAGLRKALSVGVAAPLTQIEIVDLDTGTSVLPRYQRGEIRVRGPQMIESYRNRQQETAATIRDGWIHTGDIGYFDDDGYLFVVDRKKELIISGGFNIFPREIDEVLSQHPDTLEVATVGVKESFRGEVPKVFVVLKPGRNVSVAELLDYCKERLADYKIPQSIEFLDALPKTGPGKIDKLKLRGLRDQAPDMSAFRSTC